MNVVRLRDLWMLRELVAVDVDVNAQRGGSETLTTEEHDAFVDMLEKLDTYPDMHAKGRRWAEAVCQRVGIDATPPELRAPVPRGAEVPLAPVLRNLPLRPPSRRA